MSSLLITNTTKYVTQTLQYGSVKIPYRVYSVSSTSHKVKIDILPNGTVCVLIPETTTLGQTKSAVQKRARWIYQHVTKINKQNEHVLTREYVSGECHFYLGRRYVLKVFSVKNIAPSVKLFRGQLQVRTKSRHPDAIKSLLGDWYREHAEKVFSRRISAVASGVNWVKTVPNWKTRPMKKQWGSCSPKGVISLNPSLIKAPVNCIDYVILHELCHIKEHNHSSGFYKLLNRHMPEWETIKSRLDGLSELLLAE